MAESVSESFIAALRGLEKNRDADTLASLFAENAEVGNVIAPEKFRGVDGARDFWTKYRDTFDTIESSFSTTIEGGGHAALEWTTQASGRDGEKITYEGVSILEIENGKIRRFHAYFDPAALGRQMHSSEAKAGS